MTEKEIRKFFVETEEYLKQIYGDSPDIDYKELAKSYCRISLACLPQNEYNHAMEILQVIE